MFDSISRKNDFYNKTSPLSKRALVKEEQPAKGSEMEQHGAFIEGYINLASTRQITKAKRFPKQVFLFETIKFQTPTVNSPRHTPLSIDGTPRVNGFSGFTPQTDQTFFGEHEPLFCSQFAVKSANDREAAQHSSDFPSSSSMDQKPAKSLSSNSAFSNRIVVHKQKPEHLKLRDVDAVATNNSSIGVDSPGLSASMFQFSPMVEHFLQTLSNKGSAPVLPELVVDTKTPEFEPDSSDLSKVSSQTFVKIQIKNPILLS